MTDYERIFDFQNLYKAHRKARLGKRNTREVIEFELHLSENLTKLSDALKNKTYQMSGYYSFYVHDPKERKIHALHYADRVVQHCICDEVLAPALDKKLIYDNAACRLNKGTHFALERVSGFLRAHFRKKGANGYFLKCDIRKFFENIDHEVLKQKLRKAFDDKDLLALLFHFIDSFETAPGKGLPLGNQTSQWFAIYYLDGFDRLIKEKLQIKHYSRYMDDCVLIHDDKSYLKECLSIMTEYIHKELKLDFNEKTQIYPIQNGVNYLGWHLYLTKTGKVVRKVKQQTKYRYKRKLKRLENSYGQNQIELEDAFQVLASYRAHFSYGHTYKLQNKVLGTFTLKKQTADPL